MADDYARNERDTDDVDSGGQEGGQRGPGGRRFGGRRGGPGGGARRRRVCQFCADKVKTIDYKDVNLLRQFTARSGRIVARRKTGACAKHQRILTRAVKRARHLAFLPYTAAHSRGYRP